MTTSSSAGFHPAPKGTTIDALETPCVLIESGTALGNLARWQARCNALGIANRPHVKTHKSTYWTHRQMELGAIGVTCQTLREAEVMADAGIGDILIAYNVLGASKLNRLAALARRVKMSVVADSAKVVQGLAAIVAQQAVSLTVLVECDSGAKRCGVKTPEAAQDLAAQIAGANGLNFGGLMTYPPPGGRKAARDFLARAKALCENAGLAVAVISSGGTPDKSSDDGLDLVTEYRAGTYIYNDRSLINRGACSADECALNVLASVVSHLSRDRAIIDAGSKVLTSDLLGMQDYGLVIGQPGVIVSRLDEEHGYLDKTDGNIALDVGDKVRIIPNHACVVSNLFDRVALVNGNEVLGFVDVNARERIDWAKSPI